MTKSNLKQLIDAYGLLKAELAELNLREKALKEALADLSAGSYEGEQFRLSIAESERETLDMAAVREHLSRQFIQAHTNVTPVRTLRVVARSGKHLAA
jgi:hypothetical protein